VLDLLAHGKEEEQEPVHDQDGPEDWDVEELEPAAEKANGDGASGPVPELELGKATDEGLELLVRLGGQGADGTVLHVIVELVVGGVELGLQEGEEEVEEVDTERISDDVPSLGQKDTKEEENQTHAGADPSVQNIRRRLVQESLVLLELGVSLAMRGPVAKENEKAAEERVVVKHVLAGLATYAP
jgi:hypothetical protein